MKINAPQLLVVTFLLVIMGVLAQWIIVNRHVVLDTFDGFFYNPTAQVAQLEEDIALTGSGIRIWRATSPEVATSASFNSSCPRQEAKSAILGCYTGEDRIYVYDVESDDLDGIEEVTAAHELLHAAWTRLPSDEQDRLSDLLMAAYNEHSTAELRERVAYYERTEPTEVANELHSILGTEYSIELGDELEEHYAQYFLDRGVVATYYAQYSKTYTEAQEEVDALYEELNALSASISAQSEAYTLAANQLNTDVVAFNAKADAGGFTSQYEFNSERAALVARSSALEADRVALNSDIDEYNAIYAEYQIAAEKLQQFNNSLDSFETIDQTTEL